MNTSYPNPTISDEPQRTVTVKELIEELMAHDQNMPVGASPEGWIVGTSVENGGFADKDRSASEPHVILHRKV